MGLFKKESKIEKLTRNKQELVLQRDKALRDMRNRNSQRETKITILENESQTDYENTQKRVVEFDSKIEKAVRDIESELKYINEIADREKMEYLNSKLEETQKKEDHKKKFKGDLINE